MEGVNVISRTTLIPWLVWNTTDNSNYTSLDVLMAGDMCMMKLGPLEWVLISLYCIIFVIDVTGNGIVCYLILTDKQLRTITNLFLVNLALADIAKAFICIPFTLMTNLIYKYWPFGGGMCTFITYTQLVVVFASAFTMVAMSIDRYIAILHPLRPKLSYKGVFAILTFVWILAFTVPTPTAVTSTLRAPPHNHTENCSRLLCLEDWPNPYSQYIYSQVIMLAQYGIPLLVLAFTYVRIALVIWIKRTPGEAVRSRDERMANSKRKMVKMMIAVVTLYAVCWLPVHVVQITGDNNPAIYKLNNFRLIWNLIQWLGQSHACCNPVIYFWMNKKFRIGFVRILKLLVCNLKESVHRRQSTTHYSMTMNIPSRQNSEISHHRFSTCTHEFGASIKSLSKQDRNSIVNDNPTVQRKSGDLTVPMLQGNVTSSPDLSSRRGRWN